MISSSRLAATPRQLGSSAPRKAKSTAKVLRERIKRNDDERLPRLLNCHEKRCGSPKQRRGHEKHARAGGNEPETTCGRNASHRSCGGAPPRPRPTCGHEGVMQKARKFSARNICPNLDSRKHRELKRKLSEHAPTQRKARAREHPPQRRTHDHRATSPAAGPRRARGSAAAKRAT